MSRAQAERRAALAAMELPLAAVDEAQRCVARIRRLQAGLETAESLARESAEPTAASAMPWEIEQTAEETARAVGRLVRLLLRRAPAEEPGATAAQEVRVPHGEDHGNGS